MTTDKKAIQSWQIKKMWAMSKGIGMDDGDLYALSGVDSLHELSYQDANHIIARLIDIQGSYSPKKRKEHSSNPGGATAEQQRKVWALMYELKKHDKELSTATLGQRLCGIIRKELNMNSAPEKPFIWLNVASTIKLIDILKRYVKNAERGGEN